MTAEELFEKSSKEAKHQITDQRNALVNYFTEATGEEVFGSAYTLLIYDRIYNLLMEDPEFQTNQFMEMIIEDNPPIMGTLTKYCVDHNVLNLDNIRQMCLDCLKELTG